MTVLTRWLCLLRGLYLSGTITRPGMTFSGLFCKLGGLLYITPAWGLKCFCFNLWWCRFCGGHNHHEHKMLTWSGAWTATGCELRYLLSKSGHVGSEWNKWCESVQRIAAKENISIFFCEVLFFQKASNSPQRVPISSKETPSFPTCFVRSQRCQIVKLVKVANHFKKLSTQQRQVWVFRINLRACFQINESLKHQSSIHLK